VAVPYMRPHCHVLDFGSGPVPVPSRMLEDRGFGVTTYDPFFAPDESWRKVRWETILVHEVAEHLVAPGTTLALLAGILRPGGLLCVRTRFLAMHLTGFADWAYRLDASHTGFFSARSALVMAGKLMLLPVRIEEPDRIILRKPFLEKQGNEI